MSEDELPQHSADGWAALAVDFLDFARARKPGTALRAPVQPDAKEHGWESPHTVAADRQRRHAVPGRLGDHGAGRAGHRRARARPSGGDVPARQGRQARWRSARALPESLMHLEIDRQPRDDDGRRSSRRSPRRSADVRAIVRDWSRCATSMLQIADELGIAQACRSTPRRAPRRRNSCAGRPTTISPSSATASTRWSSRATTRCCVRVDGTGLGLLRGHDAGQAALAEVAGRRTACTQSGSRRRADPDQDQCALHRASPGLHGLHRRAGVRRQGQAGRASSASSACTPPAPTTAARGTSRWCASATNT